MRILIGGVAEVPEDVVQDRIGIAAAAATAAASFAVVVIAVVVATAELLWHRNQIQARYLPVVHSRGIVVTFGSVGSEQGRVLQM